MQPFYNPKKSYEQNFTQGPFGAFATPTRVVKKGERKYEFLGHALYSPFGIPAGPLLNGKFVTAAFRKGFDVATYKTVRTRPYPSHPAPNVLAVHIIGDLTLKKASKPLQADSCYTKPLSITNSFGVPSMNPDWWQRDMEKARMSAGKGQVMVASFQGTKSEDGSGEKLIADYVLAARLVKETGVEILEANLSCPNERTNELLCFDVERVKQIAFRVKNEIGDTPLILKLAYFASDEHLEKLIKAVGKIADGLSAINTIPAAIVDKNGEQALPGAGRLYSGVCGTAISWAGKNMVRRLKKHREGNGMTFKIIGVGGVMSPADVLAYRKAGADLVQSATGAIWNANLAKQVYRSMKK